MKITPSAIISIALIIILVANLALFAFQKINTLLFWLIIIICALIAYKGLPVLKKKST